MLIKHYTYIHKTRIVAIILGIVLSSIFLIQVYTTEQEDQKIVFLLDISHSMNTTDLEGKEGQKISRLHKAKEIITETIDSTTIHKIGLIVFTQKANYLIPPSLDHQKVKTSTHRINSDTLITQGSDINEALLYAKATESENQLTVLLTDGGEGESQYTGNLVKKLIIVPIGSTKGGEIRNPDGTIFFDQNGEKHISKINEKKLQNLAANTGITSAKNAVKTIQKKMKNSSNKLTSGTKVIQAILLAIFAIIGL